MNVRVTPIDQPRLSRVYSGVIDLQMRDGESLSIPADAYLEYSVDEQGAVT